MSVNFTRRIVAFRIGRSSARLTHTRILDHPVFGRLGISTEARYDLRGIDDGAISAFYMCVGSAGQGILIFVSPSKRCGAL